LINQGPRRPWAPKSKTKIRPDTMGETVKGRSIKVRRNRLPGNSNLARAQAAVTPKIMLRTTATAAVFKVRARAAKVSGSFRVFSKYPIPLWKAPLKTVRSGTMRNTVMKAKARAIKIHCTHKGSVSIGLIFCLRFGMFFLNGTVEAG
jgi:hypothetical protein